jgi:type IV pilus biogenesis protein CpaD/CtpE
MLKPHLLIMLLLATISLSACNVTTPPDLAVKQGQVVKSEKVKRYPLASFSKAKAEVIVKDYQAQNLAEPLRLIFTYAQNKHNAEKMARDMRHKTENIFKNLGLTHLQSELLATDEREAGQLLIAYTAYIAKASDDCRDMPTEHGAQSEEINKNYKIGCGIQNSFMQQVADPQDLLGRAGLDRNDAKRAGIMAEPYMVGTPNEPLDGLRSSDVSGQ